MLRSSYHPGGGQGAQIVNTDMHWLHFLSFPTRTRKQYGFILLSWNPIQTTKANNAITSRKNNSDLVYTFQHLAKVAIPLTPPVTYSAALAWMRFDREGITTRVARWRNSVHKRGTNHNRHPEKGDQKYQEYKTFSGHMAAVILCLSAWSPAWQGQTPQSLSGRYMQLIWRS